MSGIVQHPANLGLPYEGGGCPGACVTGPWPFARTRRLRYITPPVVALWKFASAASAATSDGNPHSSVAENEVGDLPVRSDAGVAHRGRIRRMFITDGCGTLLPTCG